MPYYGEPAEADACAWQADRHVFTLSPGWIQQSGENHYSGVVNSFKKVDDSKHNKGKSASKRY